MIMKNKGEWSEAYTLLKLLMDGVIFEQNDDGSKSDSYMRIPSVIKIMKDGTCYEFNRNEKVVDCVFNGEKYKSISIDEVKLAVKNSFEEIKLGTGRSFPAPKTEKFFIEKLELKSFKADSEDKNDIYLRIENPKDRTIYVDGFSVKSLIGKAPTLFNCSNASNLVFSIENCSESDMNEFNKLFMDKSCVFKDALLKLDTIKHLEFVNSKFMESKNSKYGDLKIPGNYFAWNVDLLDIRILDVLSEMTKKFFLLKGKSRIIDLLEILKAENPLEVQFPDTFYEMKIRQFLFASFCGLTASERWNGKQKVNGGYLEVQPDGEILYQKAISDEKFTDYLIKTTKIDGPSRDKYNYGYIYFDSEYNKYCIDLNFQIRFR